MAGIQCFHIKAIRDKLAKTTVSWESKMGKNRREQKYEETNTKKNSNQKVSAFDLNFINKN